MIQEQTKNSSEFGDLLDDANMNMAREIMAEFEAKNE